MSVATRELVTSEAIKFAMDWLEQNPVKIEPLKAALAERMAQWEHARSLPRKQREMVIEVAASRAVRQHIEKLKANKPWWKQG
jgi:hypothetical protein